MDFVYTIGHSTHSPETLIGLLGQHGVTAVADVRSTPYSRFNPQFNREALTARLKASAIAYVFLGRELGGRSDDRECFVDGRISYERLARTPAFQAGLDRVAAGLLNHHVALLCAEKDPLTCHRTILVCRFLAERGIGAKHILEDGGIEDHEAALDRLLAEHGIAAPELFLSREDLISEAYAKRARQIAYSEKQAIRDAAAHGQA
jgi:uncharacterized protein (DUF488 family)